jgi:hypothetical protein
MNPLLHRLKHKLPTVKGQEEKKVMNTMSPSAQLSIQRKGGWKGYFVTVDGQEKQITKHKYFTHPKNIERLLTISKTGNAVDEDKDLINYYKKLSTSDIEYKVPGVTNDNINLEPKFETEPKEAAASEEPKESEIHVKPVQMNIGKDQESVQKPEEAKTPEQSSENDDTEGK